MLIVFVYFPFVKTRQPTPLAQEGAPPVEVTMPLAFKVSVMALVPPIRLTSPLVDQGSACPTFE
jgi:hypothetical protein